MSEADQFGESFDFPPFEGQPKVYLIASSQRTGSHYLCHLFFSTGRLGSPFEYFHRRNFKTFRKRFQTKRPEPTMRKLMAMRTSPNGWFGIKAHWGQFSNREDLGFEPSLVPVDRYVYLKRRDQVLQAISRSIAVQTQQWMSHYEKAGEPVYEFADLDEHLRSVRAGYEKWERYFAANGIEPLTMYYEDLCADPVGEVQRALAFFGEPTDIQELKAFTQRQATDLNHAWKQRYLDDLEKAGRELV